MSSAAQFTATRYIGFTNTGEVASYGTVEFRDHDTGEVVYTYSTSDRISVNADPVVLDSSGKADIYLDDGTYDITLKDSSGTIIDSVESFTPPSSGSMGGDYQGDFTPEAGDEYPTTDNLSFGDYYTVTNVYTWVGGDLAGSTSAVNDIISYGVNGWSLLAGSLDPAAYLKKSGDSMSGDMDMNSNKITELPTPTADSEPVTLGMLNDILGGSGVTMLKLMPLGTIWMFGLTVGTTVPAGWQICDGTNGTPDMRNKFARGSNTYAEVGNTGGTDTATMPVHEHALPSHSHTATTESNGEHSHTYIRASTYGSRKEGTGEYTINTPTYWSDNTGSSGGHSHTVTVNSGGSGSTGVAGSGDNVPSFVSVVYIMRVS